MENYYKQEAEYYQKRYEATQDNLNELHYQLGWLRGSLERLKKLVESGKVNTASEHQQRELESIMNAYQTSVDEAKAYSNKTVVAEQS
jgi:Fic family protein